jgi:hypothetical protein
MRVWILDRDLAPRPGRSDVIVFADELEDLQQPAEVLSLARSCSNRPGVVIVSAGCGKSSQRRCIERMRICRNLSTPIPDLNHIDRTDVPYPHKTEPVSPGNSLELSLVQVEVIGRWRGPRD